MPTKLEKVVEEIKNTDAYKELVERARISLKPCDEVILTGPDAGQECQSLTFFAQPHFGNTEQFEAEMLTDEALKGLQSELKATGVNVDIQRPSCQLTDMGGVLLLIVPK